MVVRSGVVFNASSKFLKGISLGKIFNSTEAEKLHIMFGKFILGVHGQSANYAVMISILFRQC